MTTTTAPTPDKIPGPLALPFIGGKANFLRFVQNPFVFMKHLYSTYGDIVGIGRGDASYVFVVGPTLNHEILSNAALYENSAGPFLKAKPDTVMGRLFLNNLAVMNGSLHKQQRKLQQPAFHRQQIAGYHADMVRLTEHMVDTWQAGTTLDIHRAMQQLTQRIAVKTLFGVEDLEELATIEALLNQVVQSISSPLTMMLPFDIPGLPYARVLHLSEAFESVIKRIIQRKRQAPGGTDVLAALIHAQDEDGTTLTDDQLVGHAFTLFVAGHETTATTLAWTLFLLSQHPQAGATLAEELQQVLGGAAPTLEQTAQLPYLDGVIKEGLRLLGPAPIGIRLAVAPTTLAGYTIPKGANVFFSQFMTHRLPDLYPDPYRFVPERWATLQRTIYEYLPFAAGVHMCIGAGFATQELKVVLATIWQRYRLALVPNSTLSPNVGMRPAKGLPMTLHPQDGKGTRVPVRGKIHELVDLGA